MKTSSIHGNFLNGISSHAIANGLESGFYRTTEEYSGFKALDAFQAYWDELLLASRASEPAGSIPCPIPLRRDFNPMKIHRHLPDIFMAERVSDDEIKVRLSGTAIDEAAGFQLTHSNFLDVCLPSERALFSTVVHALINHPCGIKMTRDIILKTGQHFKYRAMLFPLADNEGKAGFIVGMAKLAMAETFVHPNPAGYLFSEITDFEYIDIGAGVPKMPESALLMPKKALL